MEFIKNWVTNIAMIIIFGSFVELIIPQNNFKKYIQMIIGLMIIFTVIQPISFIAKSQKPFHLLISEHEINVEKVGIQNQAAWLSKQQKKQTIYLFQKKIEAQVKEQVKKEKEIREAEVAVEIETDPQSKQFGQIKKMEVTIVPNKKESAAQTVSIGEIKIRKVDVESKKTIQEKDRSLAETYIVKNIKNLLSNFYNLSPSNIDISVQNR